MDAQSILQNTSRFNRPRSNSYESVEKTIINSSPKNLFLILGEMGKGEANYSCATHL